MVTRLAQLPGGAGGWETPSSSGTSRLCRIEGPFAMLITNEFDENHFVAM